RDIDSGRVQQVFGAEIICMQNHSLLLLRPDSLLHRASMRRDRLRSQRSHGTFLHDGDYGW
ncbi:hypothetical protein K0U00_34955, partial [Paenibacillus sepulcri]|nr:hypothetical protein [Paenibacillus sepulcri]